MWRLLVAVAVLASGCAHLLRAPKEATRIQMDFTRQGGFYSAPFPSEDLRRPDGRIDLSGFPGRGSVSFVDAALEQVSRDARGFSTTAGIFFSATAWLDRASLPPTAAASLEPKASVYLLDVERGERVPVDVGLVDNGGRFGADNLLSLVPYQGVPLRPSTLYVAVVTARVRDAWGRALGQSEALEELRGGGAPEGLSLPALAELRRALPRATDAVAVAVFRTDAPLRGMQAVVEALAHERPLPNAPFELTQTHRDFCVYQSTIDLPQYQVGQPPFASEGGTWVFDEAGRAVRQRYERARIVVTLPKGQAPLGGWPVVVFARTGAGGDRPLVDHGAAGSGGEPLPGTGPAMEFARAGFAGVMIDGPLGGLRNPEQEDEQFLVFNLEHPEAIRDNIRQSAAELVLAAELLPSLALDARGCGATGAARLDAGKVALFGHSMGATIAPLALAFQPRYRAAILSGSGGSFIANVLHKQKPLPVRLLTELTFGYTFRAYSITQGDPALSMVQWALEPSDPPVYGGLTRAHVLMFQGIVDHYILPPMANAASLSLGLDLAGDELDRATAELEGYAPYREVAAFAGRGVRPYPVEGNARGGATAVVVQREGDGIQDGHEVVFQALGPKYQYRCFLSTFAAGTPRVVAPRESTEVCGDATVLRAQR